MHLVGDECKDVFKKMTSAYWLYKRTSGEEGWCNRFGFTIYANIPSNIKKEKWCEKLKYDFVTLGLLIS